MEKYKQYLLNILTNGEDEGELIDSIRSDPKLHYVNENLNSIYVNDHYEPAVIYKSGDSTTYYWLFDGDIRDCSHPFRVICSETKVISVMYYSSDRIKEGKPLHLFPWCGKLMKYYNTALGYNDYVLDDYESTHMASTQSIYELAEILPGEISPRCERFDGFKMSFAD